MKNFETVEQAKELISHAYADYYEQVVNAVAETEKLPRETIEARIEPLEDLMKACFGKGFQTAIEMYDAYDGE